MNLGIEDEFTEFKKSTSELREGMESIASILNKHGRGTLYFGVRPDGEVVGQDVTESTLRQVSQAVGNRIEPRIYPMIERLEDSEGHAYIKVTFAGDAAPYACDGRYRIRSADEDLSMSTAQLRLMMRRSLAREDPWDRRASRKTLAQVNEAVLRRFVQHGKEAGRIPFVFDDATSVLGRLGLLTVDGQLTNAAAVCFTESDFGELKLGVLADHRRVDILDNHQEQGTLFELVDAADFYILNNTRRRFVIDGSSLERKEIPEIPREAVREALFNAFAHRDYEDLAGVQVDIYWDMLDIYNAGTFAADGQPEAYISGMPLPSKSPNRLITQTLYRGGFIEAYGTGLKRMNDECTESHVPFEVTEESGTVHVRFVRNEGQKASDAWGLAEEREDTPQDGQELAEDASNSRSAGRRLAEDWPKTLGRIESLAISLLAEHGLSTSLDVAEALGISARSARRALSGLVDKGIVEAEGNTTSRRYRLCDGVTGNER